MEETKRYQVWELEDNSGEWEVVDTSRIEPQTRMIGSKEACEDEAAALNSGC